MMPRKFVRCSCDADKIEELLRENKYISCLFHIISHRRMLQYFSLRNQILISLLHYLVKCHESLSTNPLGSIYESNII